MMRAIYITKMLTILLLIIFITQLVFVAKLITANLYLKHEIHKGKEVETQTIVIDKNCEICNPCKSFTDLEAQ